MAVSIEQARDTCAVTLIHPQSFSALVLSLGGQPQQQRAPASSSSSTSAPAQKPSAASTNGAKNAPTSAAAGVKRKIDESTSSPASKLLKLGDKGTAAPVHGRPSLSTTKATSSPSNASAAAYRGTAKLAQPAASQAASSSTTSRPGSASAPPSRVQAPVAGTPKPARGFAATLAKAQAAAEAAKAAGTSAIKHKSVEKRYAHASDRARYKQLSRQGRGGKVVPPARGRSAATVVGQAAGKHTAQETSYKGTMKKKKQPAEPLSYKGTMRAVDPAAPRPKPALKKGQPQDKYGGYASWSDLDDAESEAEEDYESDASSVMEGGLDDIEREETAALRAARREDQEALEEEERRKREKIERNRKLSELSKSAAARKKY